MADSAHPTGLGAKAAGLSPNSLVLALKNLGSKVSNGAKSFLFAMQTAQMMSTLAKMSDKQLSDIGITRSDIPQYAEKLLRGE